MGRQGETTMRIRSTRFCLSLVAASGLALVASSGCGGDDDDGGRAFAGEAGETGEDTGGRPSGGAEEGTGGRATGGAAGEEATGGRTTGGQAGEEATGGRASGGQAGEEATGGEAGEGLAGAGGGAGTPGTGGAVEGGAAGVEVTGGSAGQASGGQAGEGPGGAAGTGGTTGAGVDDLIGAICDWEFSCCDAGEVDYRLGPFTADAADCRERFVYELHESNQTSNPYVSGSAAAGLLATLAYGVRLDRVTENATGIAECLAMLAAMECNTEAEVTHCDETLIPGESPCSLSNLFHGALALDEECTLAMTEGDGNDVECAVGSTCLDSSHPDNPHGFAACIRRGLAGDPCTNDDDCDWNFYCDNSTGDCTEKGDAGDDCTFNDPSAPAPNDEDAGCKAGLKCNPVSLTCIANCTEGYVCNADFECPDGQSCAPVTVGDDTTSFHVCRPLGSTAAARCDDDDDCVASRYCDGSVCVADQTIPAAAGVYCDRNEQCEEGSFCDLSFLPPDLSAIITPAEQCVGLFQPNEGCYPFSVEGGWPSGCPVSQPYCIWDPDDARFECATARLNNGATCREPTLGYQIGDAECVSGLCEVVNLADGYECTSGAGLGDDCDDDVTDDTALRCGEGLYCLGGVCVAQVEAGGDCEDPDSAGTPNDNLCKNGMCEDQWDTILCSDAPIPESAGGTNVTCDGS
jgi:hypothetical protein